MKTINIEDYKPHLTIVCEKGIHIIPLSVFKKIVDFKLKITELEDYETIIPRILEEWLAFLKV